LQSKSIVRAGASFIVPGERRRLARLLSLAIPAAAALALSGWAGVRIAREAPVAAPEAAQPAFAAEVYGALFDPGLGSGASAEPSPILLADRFAAWPGAEPSLDPAPEALAAPAAPVAEAQSALEAQDVAALAEAMSASRPPSHLAEAAAPPAPPAASRRPEPPPVVRVAVAKPAPLPKLFDAQPPAAALGYASAEDGDSSFAGPSSRYDRWTAVYDVSAHTVYLPNGFRLEAHSGLGGMKDDPRYVGAVNRGATPPDLYQLTPVGQLFHGVAALRLNPVGGVDPFGRTGLLAHTYMLGPRGDSNGCVVFRDYAAFLRAYQNGQIRRLAVVARL
jgi:hypothetical protein